MEKESATVKTFKQESDPTVTEGLSLTTKTASTYEWLSGMSAKRLSLDFRDPEKYLNTRLNTAIKLLTMITHHIIAKSQEMSIKAEMRGDQRPRIVAYLGQKQKRDLALSVRDHDHIKGTTRDETIADVTIDGVKVIFVDMPDHLNITTLNP